MADIAEEKPTLPRKLPRRAATKVNHLGNSGNRFLPEHADCHKLRGELSWREGPA